MEGEDGRREGEDGRREGGKGRREGEEGRGRMDGWKGEEGRMECVVCALTSFEGGGRRLKAGASFEGRGRRLRAGGVTCSTLCSVV